MVERAAAVDRTAAEEWNWRGKSIPMKREMIQVVARMTEEGEKVSLTRVYFYTP